MARTALKVLVSAGLIALALRGVDISAVRAQLSTADPLIVLVAIALTTAIAAIHAERWRIVLGRMGRKLPFLAGLKLVLIGYFFNQTLPSTVGGDAFRAWGAYRGGIRIGDAVTSVIIDRVFALASLVVMIVIGLPWLFELITAPPARWIVVSVIAGGVVGMTLLLSLHHISATLARWRVTRLLVPIANGARAVFGSARGLAAVLLLTIFGYAVLSYVVHLLARGLAVDLNLGNALLLIPLVTLVSVLPVSIAGWGLRESAMVVAMSLIGVPAVAAFSLSVLFGLVVMASGVPGGLIWLVSRRIDSSAARTGTNPDSRE